MRNLFLSSTLGLAAASMALALSGPIMADPGGKGGGGGGGHGGGGGGGGPAAHGGGGDGGGKHGGGGNGGGGNPWAGGGGGGGGKHGGGGGGGNPWAGGGGRHGGGNGGGHAWSGGKHGGAARAEHGRGGAHGHAGKGGGHERIRQAGGHAERGGGHFGKTNPGQAGKIAREAAPSAVRFVNGPAGRGDARGVERISFRGERPNLLKGCPPGLAKKYNGCNPPGLVRQQYVPWQADWWGYRDGGYRYYDGYLLRTSGPTILGYIPLLGGALFIGEIWPIGYETAPLPRYYSDYYDLGPDYRYYDDTFYRLEPGSGRIDGIAGFLTGDEFIVGRPMPIGYDVYNVPWEYRERYHDGPDAYYRYADGYIYRVDPATQLILAAIQLLT